VDDLDWLAERGFRLTRDGRLAVLRGDRYRESAAGWLTAYLAGQPGGRAPSAQVRAAGRAAGYGRTTLREAARLAGITWEPVPGCSEMTWVLPRHQVVRYREPPDTVPGVLNER
jgi:hypothetical protein